jgi:hypothetical protein
LSKHYSPLSKGKGSLGIGNERLISDRAGKNCGELEGKNAYFSDFMSFSITSIGVFHGDFGGSAEAFGSG